MRPYLSVILSGMDLTLFTDADWDGVADGPGKTLVKGICSPESIRSRGTDHSTNGIRMGIDGWIYIAVGDFGFSNAMGTDGTQLTLLGGGIVRKRRLVRLRDRSVRLCSAIKSLKRFFVRMRRFLRGFKRHWFQLLTAERMSVL